jgi:hypothetical protein
MSYSKQSKFSIHSNCVNFRNGLCSLTGAPVDPDGNACPNYTPKSLAETPHTTKVITGAIQPYEPRLPQAGHDSPIPIADTPWVDYGNSTMQGAGLLFMSSGRRGRGGGGGRGRGRMGGFAAGPGGSCVCPRCRYSTSHVIGTPCYQQTCPKCGSRMTRGS